MIYLDPGHGGSDPGAQYLKGRSAVEEKTITLSVAHRVNQELDVPTVLDRTTDEDRPLERRVRRANDMDVSRFVSVHINYYSDDRPSGFECWHYPGSDAGEQMADEFIKNFSAVTPLNIRGKKAADDSIDEDHKPYLYVLANTSMPAVLLELGFLSHRHDREYLTSEEGQYFITQAIVNTLRRGV